MGPARLQKTEHTLVHYYDLLPIYNELEKLDEHYDNLLESLQQNSTHYREIGNYDKLTVHTRQLIQEKLININPQLIKRNKRGLIDGLGTIIKFVTGNMDANDGIRINKVLKHLENNQHDFQNQILNQYSINDKLIEQFNSTIQKIQHNEILLKSRILQLHHYIKNSIRVSEGLLAKDLYNQMILLYNTILQILIEIENSITFCKIGAMHPSIIKATDLLNELQRISPYYGNQLPFQITPENIINYESLIKVSCHRNNNQINYFLSIPIEHDIPFELYYLEPLPTLIKEKYFTIIPNSRFLLKSEKSIRPLYDRCTKSDIYHCPWNLLMNINTTCEAKILQENKPSNCLYTEIHTKQDHIEPIPFTDKYLGWFNQKQALTLDCPKEKRTINPHGILLIDPEETCKIIFNEQELMPLEKSHGTPMLIEFDVSREQDPIKITNMSIQLETLNLGQLRSNPITPIHMTEDNDLYTPSIWTILLYTTIIIGCGYFSIKWYIRKFKKKEQPNENLEMKPTQLPSQASF